MTKRIDRDAQDIDHQVLQDIWLRALEARGSCTFRVVGRSMSPLIDLGDRVVVASVADPASANIGEIALFKSGSRLVAHRLIDKVTDGGRVFFRQSGDVALGSTLISADQIVGVVTRIEKPASGAAIDMTGSNVSLFLLSRAIKALDSLYYRGRRVKGRFFPDNTHPFPGRLSRLVWALLKGSHRAALVTFLALDGVEAKAKVTGVRLLRRVRFQPPGTAETR